RLFRFAWQPKAPGKFKIGSRATDSTGATQPADPVWNPSGYLYNAIALVMVAACRSDERPPPSSTQQPPPAPPAAPTIDRAALLEGKMPESAPEMELINAQCRICHSLEYLTQQRLSEPAWRKTIDKMRKFGATLSDADAAALVAFAARYWNQDLPMRTWTAGPPPAGA